MYDYDVVLGITGVLFGFFGYAPYFRDIFRGTTKPHPFTWLVWGLLDATVCFAQISKGESAGAWVLGFSAAANFLIVILALLWGERRIALIDWICLAGAFVSIALWQITRDPTLAVVLVTLTDALAFVPTYRKGYLRPDEETVTEFGFAAAKFALGFLALTTLSVTTALYPGYLVVANTVFVAMVLVRRRQLAAGAPVR